MSESLSAAKNETEQLVNEYLADPKPDLKDIIILQCSGMVERIARRFAGIEPLDDLVQVGYIGLLNALSKFDQNAGVRFNTYATHLVAGEIKHYLRDKSQIIRHPAWYQELRQRLAKSTVRLQAELGRQPTEREVAEHCGVSEQSVREVFATQDLFRVTSLDAPVQDEDESESDLDKLDATSQCQGQVSVEERLVLETAMLQLRDLEREVLVLFHFDSLNQTEIASKLDISCNYVSHILRQSHSKLRKILTNEELSSVALESAVDNSEILDNVTGSYSEKYFMSRLTEEIHRASGTGENVGLIVIEYSGLKGLRNFFGESSVRDFLADSAGFLRDSVRTLDVVCRVGESGFGIIMPNCGSNGELVRERLVRRVTQWMTTRAAASSVKVNLQYAAAPQDGNSVNELLEAIWPKVEKPAA